MQKRYNNYRNPAKYIFALMLVLLLACEKKFKWTYEEVIEGIPVVESIITNENTNQIVKLSLVRTDPNSENIPLSGANVSVTLGALVFQFTESAQFPGMYISNDAFSGVPGMEVKLKVEVLDKTYEASDRMQAVSAGNQALFLPSSHDTTLFYLVRSGSILYTTEPAMWEFNISWDFLPNYAHLSAEQCKARIFYYDLKVLDQGQIFAPQQDEQYFPEGAQVIQTKYSLSDKHKEFRRSLLLETEWRGGFMDVSPGTVYTNLNNGAMGFFGASAVVRDTFNIAR